MKIIIVFALFLVAVNAGGILSVNQIIKPPTTLQKIKLGKPIQNIPGLPRLQTIRVTKPIQAIPGVQRIQMIHRRPGLPVRRNILLQKPVQALKPIRTVIKKKEVSVFG